MSTRIVKSEFVEILVDVIGIALIIAACVLVYRVFQLN